LHKASTGMAETWMKTLERQTEVVWLTDGAKPLLKIRKDGVLFVEKSGTEIWIPLNQFNIKPVHGLDVQIFNGDQKIVKISVGAINYYPGQELIGMLANKQRSMAAATSSH